MRSIFLLLALFVINSDICRGEVRVVTSTADLAYFAKEVGGDKIKVEAIASPKADIHFVEVRPSYMMKVKKADLVFKVGLELDQWIDQIIDGSHNSNLTIVDCSKYVSPVEVPEFKVDARYGDLHRFGNPHYWLTPDNIKPITDAIVEGLIQVDAANAAYYEQRQTALLEQIQSGTDKLKAKAADLAGLPIITYHNSWPYFNQFFGIEAAEFIEPYPGVPPSPTHIARLVKLIRDRKIKIIAVEPYFDMRVPIRLAEETGAKVVTLYPSIGGRDKNENYVQWLEGNLNAISEALK